MIRKNRITIALIIVAVAIVAVFGFFVRIGPTADMVVALDTAGMTCGACNEKITETLMTAAGVASVGVNVQSGKVLVGYNSQKTNPKTLAGVVTAKGYRSTVVGMMSAGDFTRLTGVPVHKLKNAGGGGCGGSCGK